jgi:MFS family permease
MSQIGILRALAHRNFRLYFAGQGVSLIGTWMQQMALSWVVYQLAETQPGLGQPEVWLGLVTFAGQIPAFFLAPIAGVLVDRVNRHRLLVLTQVLMMIQAFVLTWLDYSGQITVWQVLLLSVALLVFSLSHDLGVSLLALLVTGAAMMLHMAASNTILQTIVEEDKRGRVMSFYTMAFMGMSPLGSLLAGGLASRIGVENMVRVAGVSCIVGGVLFATALPALREQIRPIYRRMGILLEVAAGLQSATELSVPPERT